MAGNTRYINALNQYLTLKTNGALLFTGNWGAGKTYFIQNEFLKQVNTDTFFVIRVSLYGINDLDDIGKKCLESILLFNNGLAQSVFSGIGKLAKSLGPLKNIVDLNVLTSGNYDTLIKLIPKNKTPLFIFDDFERINTDKLSHDDVLGRINDLIELRNSKVIVIANRPKIKKIKYEEKTIEKRVEYHLDIEGWFKQVIEREENQKLKNWLTENKQEILDHYNPAIRKPSFKERVQENLENLRVLNFHYAHFYEIFKAIEDKGIQNQIILNIWIFSLGISSEIKGVNENLTLENRNTLDQDHSPFAGLSLQDLFGSTLEPVGQRNNEKPEYTEFEKFYKSYYPKNSKYNWFKSIFEFIVGGLELREEQLIDELSEIRKSVVEHSVQDQILNSLLTNTINYTDEEFTNDLQKLLVYARNADFDYAGKYIQAHSLLKSYHDFLEISKTETDGIVGAALIRHIKGTSYTLKGIRSIIDDIGMLNRQDFNSELIKQAQEALNQKRNECIRLKASELKESLENNFDLFIDQSLDITKNESMQPYPIEISKKELMPILQNLTPNQAYRLTELLHERYFDTKNETLIDGEINFLRTMLECADQIKPEKKLSNKIIKTNLLTLLQKIIERK